MRERAGERGCAFVCAAVYAHVHYTRENERAQALNR